MWQGLLNRRGQLCRKWKIFSGRVNCSVEASGCRQSYIFTLDYDVGIKLINKFLKMESQLENYKKKNKKNERN